MTGPHAPVDHASLHLCLALALLLGASQSDARLQGSPRLIQPKQRVLARVDSANPNRSATDSPASAGRFPMPRKHTSTSIGQESSQREPRSNSSPAHLRSPFPVWTRQPSTPSTTTWATSSASATASVSPIPWHPGGFLEHPLAAGSGTGPDCLRFQRRHRCRRLPCINRRSCRRQLRR